MHRLTIARPNRTCLALAGLLLAVAGNAPAQNSSLEQRLRAQLQATTTQLQQAQAELARRPVAAPATTPSLAADADVQRLKQQLQAAQARQGSDGQQARQLRVQLAERDQQLQRQAQQLQQLREQQAAGGSREQALASQHEGLQQDLLQCRQRNQALYEIGQDVLREYESLGVAGALRRRQPFAAQSRARYEQWAQAQGDRLYENRVGARALPPATSKDTDTTRRATGEKDEPSQVVPGPGR
ncbi:hypothetical protein [Stenotrophomonas sp. 24(2023)]|uniref:hypothetical protein n=1 Tax=Stenotrophomonas sp. 24(2023) TaxID=3068324 RepID=UPI0027E1838F|nr:hypothetical protein [Stenotrophomonas sp. 24(2023)]WMJ69386.1 hypothetical protein Q9R17_19775 [Stenotrophomonas sp. 24(2023)]